MLIYINQFIEQIPNILLYRNYTNTKICKQMPNSLNPNM